MSLNTDINNLLKMYSQSVDSSHNQHNRAMQVKSLCLKEAIRVADIEFNDNQKTLYLNKQLTKAFGE